MCIRDRIDFQRFKLGNQRGIDVTAIFALKCATGTDVYKRQAFISNVEEERKLKTATFQQEVAESILAGIKAYFADGATLARRG